MIDDQILHQAHNFCVGIEQTLTRKRQELAQIQADIKELERKLRHTKEWVAAMKDESDHAPLGIAQREGVSKQAGAAARQNDEEVDGIVTEILKRQDQPIGATKIAGILLARGVQYTDSGLRRVLAMNPAIKRTGERDTTAYQYIGGRGEDGQQTTGADAGADA